ncbi:hypothetical protein BLOT_015465 [Blomia tropicalis]|nr:hypothetical protein BLOT_015465 [Blomia tropicalis]
MDSNNLILFVFQWPTDIHLTLEQAASISLCLTTRSVTNRLTQLTILSRTYYNKEVLTHILYSGEILY